MTNAQNPKPAGFDAATDLLKTQGWCVIPNAMPVETIAALAADLAPIYEATPFCEGDFYGGRTKRFGSLLKRSRHAADLALEKLVLSVATGLLAPWCDTIQLNLMQAIALHPGAPAQFPHRDQDMWQGVKGEVEYLVNVMWPLTPFTVENGATILYPGSHGREALNEVISERSTVAVFNPGDAFLFLGSTLHGAGANLSHEIRKAVIVSYCLGWLKPYENQWLSYPPEVARTFSPELAGLVGYRQHRPNLGNYEGVCPSVLLTGNLPDHIGAVDALRPDQAEAVTAHRVAQEAAT
ncbi:phytanoyl-CoA dioxygenase family protein [Sphingomonas sp. R-74633]|uniref:phytanoyl-CoA dioxygenase family protein n=1 Tax=Sphingomonas sp. R-74633 TaxID=2751188 RepID=UPI0015D1033E|nr:phytanoyl-CoA dioxygenase family protein [Sphingomonas sp. R-74633]NYT41055.1 phytanoyl-CoA dioxygenase family protein [Sphingomonas sp. R-74633]